MKIVIQFLIITGISLAGEVLNYLLPLPVPSSIYGLVILFVLLQLKILKTESLKEVSGFFLGIMPLFFVPPSVSFINAFPILKKYGLQFFAIAVISTFAVFGITGRVVQFIMKFKNKKAESK